MSDNARYSPPSIRFEYISAVVTSLYGTRLQREPPVAALVLKPNARDVPPVVPNFYTEVTQDTGANIPSLCADLLTLSSISVLVLYALGCLILLPIARGMISIIQIDSAVCVSPIFLTPIKQTRGPGSSLSRAEPDWSLLLGPSSKLQ